MGIKRNLCVVAGEVMALVGGACFLAGSFALLNLAGIEDGRDMVAAFSLVGMLAIIHLGYRSVKMAWDWQDRRMSKRSEP